MLAGAEYRLVRRARQKEAWAWYQSQPVPLWQTAFRGVGPGAIPVAAPDPFAAPVTGVTHYTLAMNQFTDQVHPTLGPTTFWGYHPNVALGGGVQPQKHLGGIIVAQRNVPIQLTFTDNLPPTHIIPVDTTIEGENLGDNRATVHLHGGLVPWISNGGPHSWFAPNGDHGLSYVNVLNPGAAINQAEYYYPMDQSARMLWVSRSRLGDHAPQRVCRHRERAAASRRLREQSQEPGPAGVHRSRRPGPGRPPRESLVRTPVRPRARRHGERYRRQVRVLLVETW